MTSVYVQAALVSLMLGVALTVLVTQLLVFWPACRGTVGGKESGGTVPVGRISDDRETGGRQELGQEGGASGEQQDNP